MAYSIIWTFHQHICLCVFLVNDLQNVKSTLWTYIFNLDIYEWKLENSNNTNWLIINLEKPTPTNKIKLEDEGHQLCDFPWI